MQALHQWVGRFLLCFFFRHGRAAAQKTAPGWGRMAAYPLGTFEKNQVGVKYLREKQIQRVGVDGNEGEVCLVDREAR